MDHARTLIREYVDALGVDLAFQGLEAELASLPGSYSPPQGDLFVGYIEGQPAMVVAFRPLEADVCEMKRMYVRPDFRGLGLGRALAETVVREAESRGYRAMRLDTLARLSSAVRLYESLGFVRIPPYYDNPLPEEVIFMERALAPRLPSGIALGERKIVERP